MSRSTDGWRGVAGAIWSERELLGAVDAVADAMRRSATVAVAFDGRGGSRSLARLAADRLAERGVACVLAAGVTTTPAAGFYARSTDGVEAAIIVTASHSPPGHVGVKIRDGAGYNHPAERTTTAFAGDLDIARSDHPSVDMCLGYATGSPTTAALRRAAEAFGDRVVIDAVHGAVGAMASHFPELGWSRMRALPFFGGETPDPTLWETATAGARRVLGRERRPERCLVASVDGDGDRLTLYSDRCGPIGSAEQAGLLIQAGVRIRRLITTRVAPQAVVKLARTAGIDVTVTGVGFKNIVAAWQPGDTTVLGLEPNGAIVVAEQAEDYFERDSLGALARVLAAFPSLADIEDAVLRLRQSCPYPQRILNSPHSREEVLAGLSDTVRGWHAWDDDDVTGFATEDGRCVLVRAAATESVTRVYTEVDSADRSRLADLLDAY